MKKLKYKEFKFSDYKIYSWHNYKDIYKLNINYKGLYNFFKLSQTNQYLFVEEFEKPEDILNYIIQFRGNVYEFENQNEFLEWCFKINKDGKI